MTKIGTIFVVLLCSLHFSSQAATLHKVEMPDAMELGGAKLILNGLGTRKATVFRVKAYVAGLYLAKKESDPQKVADSKGPKFLRMTFLTSVEKKKLKDGWSKSYRNVAKEHMDEIRPGLTLLNRYMKNMKKKDTLEFGIFPDRLEVTVKGKKKEPIANAKLAKYFVSLFVQNPDVNKSLKQGLLGGEGK